MYVLVVQHKQVASGVLGIGVASFGLNGGWYDNYHTDHQLLLTVDDWTP
jgi:hypothetical protein